MKRLSVPHLLLAILLVLILPFEQGRCACGPLGTHGARAPIAMRTAPAGCHATCCEARAASHGARHQLPGKAARSCACSSWTAAMPPVTPAIAGDSAPVVVLALLPSLFPVEPISERVEHPLALDVGSPPLPSAARAHGLRAPPASA